MEKRGLGFLVAYFLFALAAYGLPLLARIFSDFSVIERREFFERGAELLPILKMSVLQAGASTVLCVFFSLTVGAMLFRYPLRFLLILFRGTFFLPTLLVVHFTLYWLSDSEYRFGFFAVLFAHFLLNGFWLCAETIEAFRGLPREQMETARSLGGKKLRVIREFAAPALWFRLRNPVLLVFALCFGSFSLVMILGGGPPVQSLETEMFEGLRLGQAASGSLLPLYLLQGLFGLGFTWLLRPSARRSVRTAKPFRRTVSERTSSILGFGLPVVFLGIFLFPFREYFAQFSIVPLLTNETFVSSAFLSFRIGAVTSVVLSLLLFFFLVDRRTANTAEKGATFLSGLSPFLIAAGFLAFYPAFDRGEATAQFWALVFLSVLTQFTFQFRFLYAWRESESFAPFEMARTLGASPGRAFRDLLLPRWKWIFLAVLSSSFFFGFTESAVSFLYGGAEVVPFSVWLARNEARYAFQDAEAAQFFLLILWLVLVAVQWCVQSALYSTLSKEMKEGTNG